MTTDVSQLKKAIGKADLCELMSALFAFPQEKNLATGLCDGTILSDVEGCIQDIAPSNVEPALAIQELQSFVGKDIDTMYENLRIGSSALFFAPGGFPPVWPFEGPFRFAAQHPTEYPTLFRSPVTLDVEKMMKTSGVTMANDRKEPCDSIWNEFSYLSYLFGKEAERLFAEDVEGAQTWRSFADSFIEKHFSVWALDFMSKTINEVVNCTHACGTEYASLARVGYACINIISEKDE